MPVDTGFVPDDDLVIADEAAAAAPAVTEDTPTPPPEAIGGLIVLERETDPETGDEFLTVNESVVDDDGHEVIDGDTGLPAVVQHPAVEVRGQVFRLKAAIPSKVLLNLARLAQDMGRPGADKDNKRATKALSTLDNAIEKVVLEADQAEFDEFLMDADPVIEFPELNELLGRMVKRLTGFPTRSASE